MLSVESLPVAEQEEVVEEQEEQEVLVEECGSNKLSDVYTLVAKGCFPLSMSPLRRKNLRRYAQKFIIDEEKLYYVGAKKKKEKREVVIEAERKRQIFLDCHLSDLGHHLGQKKTVHRIQSNFYWLGIIRDVVDWIKVCETCQHAERAKNVCRVVRPIKVDAPWDVVGVDILGPFPETQRGNTAVTLLVDYFSKWPEAFAVGGADALSVARCISRCLYRFGPSRTLVCTQSSDFCAEVTRLLRHKWSAAQEVSALERQPQLDPLHDRTAPLLREALLRMVAEKQDEWDDFLEPLLFLFRTAVNPTTRFTPHSLMFSRRARSFPSQTSVKLLSCEEQQVEEEEVFPLKEQASSCMAVMQEQQQSLKQLVMANMNAAYKEEKRKKDGKRKTLARSSRTSRAAEPQFGDFSSPQKKPKDSVCECFPLLATEQGSGAGPTPP